jgi:hypothetical protein
MGPETKKTYTSEIQRQFTAMLYLWIKIEFAQQLSVQLLNTVKLFLYLIKHYAMKTYGEVEV